MEKLPKHLSKHSALFQAIVDMPFQSRLSTTKLGLGIVVLLLADRSNNAIHRIALSNTEMASGAVAYSAKPFHDIVVPLDDDENLIAKTIQTGEHQLTEDWAGLFVPALTPDEARFNQAGAGVACSAVYPLLVGDKEPFGAMIFSYFEPKTNIKQAHHAFMKSYTDNASLKLVDASVD
ncbi:TPA: hypothetical protein DCF80_00375 [Candidatus Saccharibacteria bacterium]|nr:hypothetical protein [Candidatus Saccharibacteria bacterium]HRK40820.1 hypothetical protein [Candidatus Saccharibacteria bacterium]